MEMILVARVRDQTAGTDMPWFEVRCCDGASEDDDHDSAWITWTTITGDTRLWHCSCRDGLARYLHVGACRHLNAIVNSGEAQVAIFPNWQNPNGNIHGEPAFWGSFHVVLTPEGEEIMHAHWAVKRLGG